MWKPRTYLPSAGYRRCRGFRGGQATAAWMVTRAGVHRRRRARNHHGGCRRRLGQRTAVAHRLRRRHADDVRCLGDVPHVALGGTWPLDHASPRSLGDLPGDRRCVHADHGRGPQRLAEDRRALCRVGWRDRRHDAGVVADQGASLLFTAVLRDRRLVGRVAFPQLYRNLGGVGFGLVLGGGLLYTLGAVVYALKRPNPWPGCSASTRSSTCSRSPVPDATSPRSCSTSCR